MSMAGADPSRSSSLTPIDARLVACPGTAMTGTPRSSAADAVISEPPRSRDSTTTTISDSPAMMRLRSGNRYADRAETRRCLAEQQSVLGHLRPQRSVLLGVHDIETRRDHARSGRPVARSRVDGLDDAAVRLAVDATCQSGDDVHARLRQAVAEVAGHVAAGRRGVAGADDGHPATVEQRRGRPTRTAPAVAADRAAAARDDRDRR